MKSTVLDQLDRYGPDQCPAMTLDQATAYNRRLARSHYENFTVVSWFCPAPLRDDFRNVYAFCRWADDLGDEVGDAARARELLHWWRSELDQCYAGAPRHPVFIALAATIAKHDIPRQPFDHLIDAFLQDQDVNRYDTWDQVTDYCTRSANPVGRLVLYLCGYRDERRQVLSDATCTALQLANFWQDVRRDIVERDRLYLPRDIARQSGLSMDDMISAVRIEAKAAADRGRPARDRRVRPSTAIEALLPAYRKAIRICCDRTDALFDEGRKLWPLIDPAHRANIQLYSLGGEAILRLIRRQDYDTLTRRPTLSSLAKLMLMIRLIAARVTPGRSHRHALPELARHGDAGGG